MTSLKKFFFILLLIIPGISNAQTVSVTGTLYDSHSATLIGANAVILNITDSSLIKGAISDVNGNFIIENVNRGNYLLKLFMLGYEDFFKPITVGQQTLDLGKFTIKDKSISLGSVTVEGKIPPATQMGDTTQFNSNAFKTHPDANAEDLISKMPGVTTSSEGKVQSQGEDVKQVLVDGKPFFGDDPTAVLKNLPADVIDKIQVFDKKSEQSQFTGYDDGNSTKTINIITKPQFRNGTFGKVYAGYGDDDRYKSGLVLNFFKDKRRISLLAQSNNINEQNFSSEDLAGVIAASGSNRQGGGGQRGGFGGNRGGGGRQQGGQGNDAGNFLVDQKNGINTTHAVGLNMSNQWKKVEFTGSYFFNYTDNNSSNVLQRQYVNTETEGLTYNELSSVNSRNINHRVNMRINYKIDSLNSILFQPKFSAQINDGSSDLFGENKSGETLLSNTRNIFSSSLTAINTSVPVLYRHSFAKRGRTFSLNVTPGYNNNDGSNNQQNVSKYFSDSTSIDSVDQRSTLDKDGWLFTSSAIYTEPLDSNNSIQLNYNTNYNLSNSDKQTFDQLETSNTFGQLDSVLSNKFKSEYLSQAAGAGYRYQKNKFTGMIGAAYQWAQLKNDQEFPTVYTLNKNFTSILPNAMMMFRFTEKRNLRMFYRSSNNFPTVEQLQEVVNNTNPLQLTTGNAALTQDWQHNLNVRYSSVNTTTNTSFFALIGGTFTQDYIGNSTIIANSDTAITENYTLAQGSQISKPVNLNEYYNFRTFLNYSFYLKAIKSNLNLNAGYSYSNTPGLINQQRNESQVSSPNGGITISSNVSKDFDFTLSTFSTFNISRNTLQKELNSDYFNQTSKIKLNVLPWKGLVLQTDLTYQYYSGIAGDYDKNYYLWNAAVGYKFLKNQQAELRFSVYDLLDQNLSITHNTTDTYYEDVTTTVLKRYYMLTFTYNLKMFQTPGTKSKP